MKQSSAKKARTEGKWNLHKIHQTCQCRTSSLALRQLEESGTIELYLWPLFQSHAQNKGSISEVDWSKASFSLLKLVNIRNDYLSKSDMNGPLAFMKTVHVTVASGGSTDESEEVNRLAFEFFLAHIIQLPSSEVHSVLQFLIMAYSNLTHEMHVILRQPLLDLVGIGLWEYMPKRYRDLVFAKSNAFKRRWGAHLDVKGKKGNRDNHGLASFLPNCLTNIMQSVKTYEDEDNNSETEMSTNGKDSSDEEEEEENGNNEEKPNLKTIYSTLQLLIDLLSNTSTRRYLRPFLLSTNFSTKCKLSKYNSSKGDQNNKLFYQLVRTLQQLESFAIEDISAAPLSEEEMASRYHERAHVLQKICHRHYSDALSDIIYAGVGMVANEAFLRKCLGRVVQVDVLEDLCHRLRLVDKEDIHEQYKDTDALDQRKFVMEVLVYHHALKPVEAKILSELPLYPDERLLWNPHLVPLGSDRVGGGSTLALPKMSLQFLTFSDYLLRCFKLLRLESAYEIRSDLVDVVRRLRPALRHDYADDAEYADEDEMLTKKRSMTAFHGWSRMGLELTADDVCPVRLIKVSPPKLGENIPAGVLAEVSVDLKHCSDKIRTEWDSIGEFDNLFLLGVDASSMEGGPISMLDESTGDQKDIADEDDVTFPKRSGIIAVRGCMVLEVRDEDGNILSEPSYDRDTSDKPSKTHKRRFKVALDPAQYASDATGRGSPFGTKVYQTLNVVVRRHGKENNFKAVLETVRGLMSGAGSVNRSIPRWLQPVLLGYGNPASASFNSPNMLRFAENTTGVTRPNAALDYGDTFLSESHLRASFEGNVIVDGRNEMDESSSNKRVKYRIKIEITNDKQIVKAASYPFPPHVTGNPVPFTPVQVKAIRSGLSPGLSMLVGPPGTGKTDVAVQIIANLYHSFPSQRTILVTHSNAALNDLFEKVMARGDIDERYCLRLGSGERDLQTDTEFDFTKNGRVNHILARRSTLLEEVQQMSESLGISGAAERGSDGSPSYTCETAAYFHLHHIKKRIEIFYGHVCNKSDETGIGGYFPFGIYLNLSESVLSAMTLTDAKKKFEQLNVCFHELAEYRPLELLRSQRQRIDYLLTKQVKIVAMTCTHAAIARPHLVELGFQYDNIIMEEAGQMLDVETFIPLLLQSGELEANPRLKRICLIGDHHQLPPVIKNMTFSKYSNFDQSLFTRLIRSGVPTIQLNKQGRSRADIANLYTWRYSGLGNLGHVATKEKFQLANPGFVHTYQLINVEDFDGRGESTPTPYYYQNTGEAEYAVALFQYMVLIGFPAAKISILTTYNGQKGLIEDIISQRCGEGTPLAGIRPGSISTVDKYQGQQNDYVILSLVRTRSVGHLRDIRRLIVAVSRSRLGLYVLCRQEVFEQCHELGPVMKQLISRPTKLELIIGEDCSSDRSVDANIPKKKRFVVDDVTVMGSIVHGMQHQMLS